MTIHTLPLGFLQANCYIVAEGCKCIAIDPGGDAGKVLDFLAKNGLELDAILLTHGHFDHVGAAEELVKATGCQLWMHESDFSYGSEHRQMFPLAGCGCLNVRFFEDGERLALAGLDISILETPGHTCGSVCILIDGNLFAGDTLFAGSIGRTDLAGGDIRWMQKSLQRLKNLETNYTVYPGHGPATTLAREKRVNPYLQR